MSIVLLILRFLGVRAVLGSGGTGDNDFRGGRMPSCFAGPDEPGWDDDEGDVSDDEVLWAVIVIIGSAVLLAAGALAVVAVPVRLASWALGSVPAALAALL